MKCPNHAYFIQYRGRVIKPEIVGPALQVYELAMLALTFAAHYEQSRLIVQLLNFSSYP